MCSAPSGEQQWCGFCPAHRSTVTAGHWPHLTQMHKDSWHFLSAWTLLWPSLQCCWFSNLKASLELKMSLSPSHSPDVCFCLSKPWIQLWSFQSRAVMLFPKFLCQVTQNTPRLFGAPCSASGALSQRLCMYHHSKLWPMLKWHCIWNLLSRFFSGTAWTKSMDRKVKDHLPSFPLLQLKPFNFKLILH